MRHRVRDFSVALNGTSYDARDLARKIRRANQAGTLSTAGVAIDSGRSLTKSEVHTIAEMTRYGGKRRAQESKRAAVRNGFDFGDDKAKAQIAAKIAGALKKMLVDEDVLRDTPQVEYQRLLYAMHGLRKTDLTRVTRALEQISGRRMPVQRSGRRATNLIRRNL